MISTTVAVDTIVVWIRISDSDLLTMTMDLWREHRFNLMFTRDTGKRKTDDSGSEFNDVSVHLILTKCRSIRLFVGSHRALSYMGRDRQTLASEFLLSPFVVLATCLHTYRALQAIACCTHHFILSYAELFNKNRFLHERALLLTYYVYRFDA